MSETQDGKYDKMVMGQAFVMPRNDSSIGLAVCKTGSFFTSVYETYRKISGYKGKRYALANPPYGCPYSADRMLSAMAVVSAHELGHFLGLVCSDFFHTLASDKKGNHNPTDDHTKIMNHSTDSMSVTFYDHSYEWTTLNLQYFRFILPASIQGIIQYD